MSGIVELSTGHVFAAGSVKAITPLRYMRDGAFVFDALGVGFVVLVRSDRPPANPINGWAKFEEDERNRINKAEAIRAEFVAKLLGGSPIGPKEARSSSGVRSSSCQTTTGPMCAAQSATGGWPSLSTLRVTTGCSAATLPARPRSSPPCAPTSPANLERRWNCHETY